VVEGETHRQREQRVTGGGGVVEEEQGGLAELLKALAWLEELGAVDRRWDFMEDVSGGEKWSPESLAVGSSSTVLLYPQRMKAER
jgi:hypothetical protein